MREERIYIYKIPMEKIIKSNMVITKYSVEDAVINGELVPISNSQLTGKINDYYKENRIEHLSIKDAIINVVVPSASGRQVSKVASAYNDIAHNGFAFNGRHYIRLCAGSGQLRNNTVTFVWDVMHPYLTEALYCGISPEDLGESFSVSKWNAYVGLSESGMQFLNSAPNVCIIGDYEEIKPHMPIDYIETVRVPAVKSERIDKTITRYYYDDPDMDFAPLNSFDGQGLADPAWVQKIAAELGYNYMPSEYILRAPWCKGLVVAFDFKTYCEDAGVTIIKDVYGKPHNVKDIDILLSTSQFKMWKVYGKYGGWDYHQASMQKYNLRWGVVIANKEHDDDYRALNYQYIQALTLDDGDINDLCKHTEDLLTQLCSGNIETVYRSLVGFADCGRQDDSEYMTDTKSTASLLQRVITHNYDLLNDTYIQSLIYREAEAKFNSAKIGKLLCRGGYSFIVSDPVAQIQHIIKNYAADGNRDIDVVGLVPACTIYSSYWNGVHPTPKKVVLMRSPLVDSSEVTVCSLVNTDEMNKWYSYIKSGLVFSIFDVNTLALQNCDFDGDRCFSSNDPILIKGAQTNPVPILYPSAGAQLKSAITLDSMIDADIRGLNSAVGTLSNLATCLYALRDKYGKTTPEYAELSRRIKIVSELVGVEIDKIKTGIPPMKPSSWNKERIPYEQFSSMDGSCGSTKVPACSPEEQERIRKHNALVPEGKPLFMRYIYGTLNRDLCKYDKAFDSVSKYNNGVGLIELVNSDYHCLNDESKKMLDKYYRNLPAIDTPCTMNKICKKFEYLQKDMKHHKGSRNMLFEYATEQVVDETLLNQIAESMDLFQRQRRFITKDNNSASIESNKQLAKNTKERFDVLHTHIRDRIFSIVGGDVQAAYNYLIELVRLNRCTPSAVWAVLDEHILNVIPEKHYGKEVAA